MNNSAQITAAALVAAATSFATAGSLDLDRAYASELKADAGARSVLNQGNLGNIEVSVGVQFGYSANFRDDGGVLGDNDTTIGFGLQEARVAIEGDVTDNMRGRVSFDFGPDDGDSLNGQGTANLEDAYVDWTVNDSFTLRIGQYAPAFSAFNEARVDTFHNISAYNSVTQDFLANSHRTQGIQATWGNETWDLSVGFTDGPTSDNTAFNSAAEADFAFNARFDFFSDSNKARFADQSSWRGSETGWRIGAGVSWASFGNTNPASPATEADSLAYTIDAAYEGDGWSAWAAFYGVDVDPDAGVDHTNYGFEVGAAVFFSDQWEGYARWDTLLLDDDAGAGQTTNEDTFNFIAVGTNYYFVPESHAAKLTLELGWSLDETGDIVNTAGDTGIGVFGGVTGTNPGSTGYFLDAAGEDSQFMLSAIMQFMF